MDLRRTNNYAGTAVLTFTCDGCHTPHAYPGTPKQVEARRAEFRLTGKDLCRECMDDLSWKPRPTAIAR